MIKTGLCVFGGIVSAVLLIGVGVYVSDIRSTINKMNVKLTHIDTRIDGLEEAVRHLG